MSFQHRFVQGFGVKLRTHPPHLLGRILLVIATLAFGASAAQAAPDVICNGTLPVAPLTSDLPDLVVTGRCVVQLSRPYTELSHYFKNVNILTGGALLFSEAGSHDSDTHFWASSIIIENGGTLRASSGDNEGRPFGWYGSVLTIHLYGKNAANWNQDKQQFDDQNQGALCKSSPAPTTGPCGIPLKTSDGSKNLWANNGNDLLDLPGPVRDYFYQYGPLHGDGKCSDGSVFTNGACRNSAGQVSPNAQAGYFGNKVLAVSYGGTLLLAGHKGALYAPDRDRDPLDSGRSWMRLADGNSLEAGSTSLVLERDPNNQCVTPSHSVLCWGPNNEIVVTTTDYLPGHSEKLTIDTTYNGGATVKFKETIKWRHNGVRYGGPKDAAGKPWFIAADSPNPPGGRLPPRLQDSLDPDLLKNGAETRAAVALLTRSIRIVSAGDAAGQDFPGEATGYSYGAHMVIRQGFASVQIQGVEFQQMGQGGRLGHYPIHFHMARQTPANTYVKDSSINESMTRWIVLHSTLGVTVARNVGYKSIGHGFYLEDGTETGNKFYSNIGIFARAAIDNPQNPRKVPGILADNIGVFVAPDKKTPGFPYRSDSEYPTVFWITNGWNEFVGNMAAGAGTCGAAYWFVPVVNSDMVEVAANDHDRPAMKWSGYADLQKARRHDGLPKNRDFEGTTPLKTFYKNYATSTMHSFQTTGDAPDCRGVVAFLAPAPPEGHPVVRAVRSDAPPATRKFIDPRHPENGREPNNLHDHYYPHAYIGGQRYATKCAGDETKGYDCSTGPSGDALQARCGAGHLGNCTVTVLNHFTSSFHWAEGNISAIWLRPQWYLLTNSVISDVQNGGLTFVTGGDYTHSSIVPGYWALARNTVFIGNTNPNTNPDDKPPEKYAYTGNAGPFNAASPLKCDQPADGPNYCLNAKEGISMRVGGLFTNQRLSNIYDGPSYQDSNAYLDITVADCPIWKNGTEQGCMYGSQINVLRLRKAPLTTPPDLGKVVPACQEPGIAYLPNAAIGWKQPNGFYYPPAFHSRNLFFDNVDLRHYVIDPLFKEGTYVTDFDAVKQQYCTATNNIFNDFTSIDRQTELTDDDGTLTGLISNNATKETVSVNDDTFFNAPVETAECASAIGANAKPENACRRDPTQPPQTAKTSPYEYVSTVVYHKPVPGVWDADCANPDCYGVPLYRQYLTDQEKGRWKNGCSKPDTCRWPFIRMTGAKISQRQTMTMNNGAYYLDTTVSEISQKTEAFSRTPSEPTCKAEPPPKLPACVRKYNVFQKNETYTLFFLYARKTTRQTYKIYVGQGFNKDDPDQFSRVRVNIANEPFAPSRSTPAPKTPNMIKPDYDPTSGILTVTIDFAGVDELDPTPDKMCQPRTFCQPSADKTQCVSAVPDNDPLLSPLVNKDVLKRDISASCATWAVKDLDCPKEGCFGFSFKLPSEFVATDQYKRPDPTLLPFPDTATQFSARQREQREKADGQCSYDPAKPPVGKPCPTSP